MSAAQPGAAGSRTPRRAWPLVRRRKGQQQSLDGNRTIVSPRLSPREPGESARITGQTPQAFSGQMTSPTRQDPAPRPCGPRVQASCVVRGVAVSQGSGLVSVHVTSGSTATCLSCRPSQLRGGPARGGRCSCWGLVRVTAADLHPDAQGPRWPGTLRGAGCQRGSPEHSAGSLSGSPCPGRAEALISSSREAHGRPGARKPCRAAALPLPLAGGAGHVCHQFAPLLPLHWRLAGREAYVGVRPVSCRWLPGGSRRARSLTCRVLSHLRL